MPTTCLLGGVFLTKKRRRHFNNDLARTIQIHRQGSVKQWHKTREDLCDGVVHFNIFGLTKVIDGRLNRDLNSPFWLFLHVEFRWQPAVGVHAFVVCFFVIPRRYKTNLVQVWTRDKWRRSTNKGLAFNITVKRRVE
eukprot:Lithocolla_globosa_v1_NODE_3613_length_1623_cov_9.801658.p2 type:complete len:137 gc:universal NODE_3613_length_1623_cov_9.801658:1019-609(-)